MKRLRNLWNLLPTELDHGPTRFLFTILSTAGLAGLATLLEEHPSWRLPFWVCVVIAMAWAVTTLLRADIRVTGDRVEYRAWRGMRSVALDDAQRGELVAKWFRPHALRPLGTNWSTRPLALRSGEEWCELLGTLGPLGEWADAPDSMASYLGLRPNSRPPEPTKPPSHVIVREAKPPGSGNPSTGDGP
jgi:hypothetical protein